ncbi:amidase [Chromobacterium violaceum]|uniref:Amidase n=1 Tax=Chromobacterium violaceum TaxID=536 RepID=A0A3S4HML0_CHRVL|nr:amidase [Chromobacterium violaceum]
MTQATLKQLSQQLAAKQVSSVELASQYLDRIEALNPQLNAIVTVDREKTLAEARAADARLAPATPMP